MIDILAKFKEVQARKATIEGPEYYQRRELKFREWDILTRVCFLLNRAGLAHPKYAAEHERPDFETFEDGGTPSWPVEITEVLRPDDRRGEFWKSDPFRNGPIYFAPEPLNDIWMPLRVAITSKSTREYPKGTSLFVYFDISLSSFSNWETPFEEQLLHEHTIKPFNDITAFGSVYVLSSDMNKLIQLHPQARTIIGTKGQNAGA